MLTLYYTEKPNFESGEAFIRKVFNDHYGITDFAIFKTSKGKPFAPETELEFSLSHTKACYFLAVSDKPVGIDAEREDRLVDHATVAKKKFSEAEQAEILSLNDFLRHWTAKEAAVKLLGGTLAQDLKKLSFLNGVLYYNGDKFIPPLVFRKIDGHVVAICGESVSESFKIVSVGSV